MKPTLKWIFFLCIVFLSIPSNSQIVSDTLKAKDLMNLSFEDLMSVKIHTGTLLSIERPKLPAAITVITRNEIENTPARNLLDLLKVYVPSGTFVNHWLGSRIGMRGVMSDQNNSFLLIVNGENMNLNYEDGPLFEIQNKDLSDIEKIEIISGPGSVTYGPGAIGGVISITTKNAHTEDKVNVGMTHNLTYRYSFLNSSVTVKKKRLSAYMFGSIGHSDGIKNPEFYFIDRAHGYGYGYMSDDWGNKGLGTAAPNFYSDFQNRPEIKAHLNIDFLDEFVFQARYTNFSAIKQQQKIDAQDGPAFPGIYGQQFTTSLRHQHDYSEKINIERSISFQSHSLGDIRLYQGIRKPFDDITQRNNSFSENSINMRSVLRYEPIGKLKIATGAEYTYWFYGAEWGKSDKSFVMNFAPSVNFVVKDANSGFYAQYHPNGIVTLVNHPIDANQISGFYEINYQPHESSTVLVSGRLDKHNMAKVAFSPRIAFIQGINKRNFLKLIVQQSVRLPNFRELYALDYTSEDYPIPEKLRSIELIYSTVLGQNVTGNFNAFYQSLNQVGWADNERSEVIGEFNTAGFETDLNYQSRDFKVALTYAFIKQLRWDPEYNFNAYLSNIGSSNMDVPLLDAGKNRINNFPQHQLKFVTSYKINKAFHIHFNSRFAAQQGQVDMLNMFKDVHDILGSTETLQEMNNIYDDVLEKGYSKPSFTSNISASYSFELGKVDMVFSTWVMNVFSVNHIRYVYQFWEEGNNRQYPRHVGFINEPRTYGMSLKAKL